MSTHNIYFRGEIRKISVLGCKTAPYLELCNKINITTHNDNVSIRMTGAKMGHD